MNRTPPAAVTRQLREEVGFGCPVPGCRSPFLTWHHFDPRWSERNHHDPEGMIALCDAHHKFADSGGWSKAQLQQFKKSGGGADSVRGKLPWARASILVRVGSMYLSESEALLKIFGRPVFGITRDENGLLNLNYEVRDQKGNLLAKIVDNMIEMGPVAPHDLAITSSATQVVVRSAPRTPVLSLAFKRMPVPDFRNLMQQDFLESKRQGTGFRKQMKAKGFDIPEPDEPDIACQFEGNSVTKLIDQYVQESCIDDEKCVSVIDVSRLRMTYRKQEVDIGRNTRVGGVALTYGASFSKECTLRVEPCDEDVPTAVCADRASSVVFPFKRQRRAIGY